MASASADTDGGYNSWFPDAGEYDCVIEGLAGKAFTDDPGRPTAFKVEVGYSDHTLECS